MLFFFVENSSSINLDFCIAVACANKLGFPPFAGGGGCCTCCCCCLDFLGTGGGGGASSSSSKSKDEV